MFRQTLLSIKGSKNSVCMDLTTQVIPCLDALLTDSSNWIQSTLQIQCLDKERSRNYVCMDDGSQKIS